MAIWTTLALLCTASSVTATNYHFPRRDIANICKSVINSTNKVQCYCIKPDGFDSIRSADCYITTDELGPDDKSWESFILLKNANKVTLTNTRGITLKYIPTKALKQAENLLKLDVKYGNINRIEPFAFANLTFLEELILRDNQIEGLDTNAFAHHRDLTSISLDKNNIMEINRDVFIDLPSLQKLFLTSNKITTLHDKAFVHLNNLRELEIDRNALFSLNSETFAGLKSLQKLDLSSNILEVIGDNTFLPLVNLRSLNLEGNKIQMLDEKAFNGLWKLQLLSLAANKLKNIENVKLFEGLDALTSLSLKDNQLRELRTEVMAPILNNFYGAASSLDVEGNNFPCHCHLDWFVSLMNKTQNNRLKLAIENLQCFPEPEIRDLYIKTEEKEKNTGQVFEDEEPQVQNSDYEYYDVSQLNGNLFYIDMRYLLNCTNPSRPVIPQIEFTHSSTTMQTAQETNSETVTEAFDKTTKDTSNSILKPTTTSTTAAKIKKVTNRGVLELTNEEATTKVIETIKHKNVVDANNEVHANHKPNHYTTTRLATVSEKPLGDKKTYDEREMAADEAKPDQLKAPRSMREEVGKSDGFENNNAQRNFGCATTLAAMALVCRLNF